MISITHTFVSGKADGSDGTQVQPSNWNATHTVSNYFQPRTLVGTQDGVNFTFTFAAVLTVVQLFRNGQLLGDTNSGGTDFTWTTGSNITTFVFNIVPPDPTDRIVLWAM